MTTQDVQAIVDKIKAEHMGRGWKVLPNTYPPQCYDVAVGYTDLLGVPHYPNNPSPFPYANAEDIYKKFGDFQAKYFDRIANTDTFVPKKGDLGVWDAKLNEGIGHVDVIADDNGTVNRFNGFDQNWDAPICKIINHNYDYFLGVLRPKVTSSGTTPQPPMNETKKAVQVDKIASWFKDQGYAMDSGTEQYFNNPADPDKFFNKVKSVVAQGQPVDTAKIKEEGRQIGLKQVKDAALAVK